MKKESKKKLSFYKLRISKLDNLSAIKGGDGGVKRSTKPNCPGNQGTSTNDEN